MELDKRILLGKRPLTCFDIEEAKQYIGKKGYFSDYLNVYANINTMGKEDVLQSLDEHLLDKHHDETFLVAHNKWKFFLPAEWVKEPEKKYRPFTLAEWIEQHGIGEVIHYRCKSPKIELRHMYTGYAHGIDADIKNTTSGTMTLGNVSHTLDDLFEDYEIEFNGEWVPFGIKEVNHVNQSS